MSSYRISCVNFRRRQAFFNAKKTTDESVTDWLVQISQLVALCKFNSNLKDIFLLEKFVAGIDAALFDDLCDDVGTFDLSEIVKKAMKIESKNRLKIPKPITEIKPESGLIPMDENTLVSPKIALLNVSFEGIVDLDSDSECESSTSKRPENHNVSQNTLRGAVFGLENLAVDSTIEPSTSRLSREDMELELSANGDIIQCIVEVG